jgi:hypothetical protein
MKKVVSTPPTITDAPRQSFFEWLCCCYPRRDDIPATAIQPPSTKYTSPGDVPKKEQRDWFAALEQGSGSSVALGDTPPPLLPTPPAKIPSPQPGSTSPALSSSPSPPPHLSPSRLSTSLIAGYFGGQSDTPPLRSSTDEPVSTVGGSGKSSYVAHPEWSEIPNRSSSQGGKENHGMTRSPSGGSKRLQPPLSLSTSPQLSDTRTSTEVTPNGASGRSGRGLHKVPSSGSGKGLSRGLSTLLLGRPSAETPTIETRTARLNSSDSNRSGSTRSNKITPPLSPAEKFSPQDLAIFCTNYLTTIDTAANPTDFSTAFTIDTIGVSFFAFLQGKQNQENTSFLMESTLTLQLFNDARLSNLNQRFIQPESPQQINLEKMNVDLLKTPEDITKARNEVVRSIRENYWNEFYSHTVTKSPSPPLASPELTPSPVLAIS